MVDPFVVVLLIVLVASVVVSDLSVGWFYVAFVLVVVVAVVCFVDALDRLIALCVAVTAKGSQFASHGLVCLLQESTLIRDDWVCPWCAGITTEKIGKSKEQASCRDLPSVNSPGLRIRSWVSEAACPARK